MIDVDREFDEIHAIRIDGESLDSDDGETWFLPKALVRGLAVNDLPEDVVFEICRRTRARCPLYSQFVQWSLQDRRL